MSNFDVDRAARGAITVGDHSYMPLGIELSTSSTDLSGQIYILRSLECFKSIHPELKVVNWKLEAYAVDLRPQRTKVFVLGLWIDHELIEKTEKVGDLAHALAQD